ncbi:MAG: hypothetical protein ACP5OP_03260 [Leptospirillia bacterium]
MKYLKILGLVLFLGLVYLGGDLIANNAAFINTPGPLARAHVYFTLNRAWTTGGYPLAEVSPQIFFGDPDKLRANITHSIGSFSGWSLVKATPDFLVVRIAPSFWHAASRLEVRLSPVRGGLRMDVTATSQSGLPDLGADRNYILNLFHEIGDENAIHPPV